MLTVMVEIAAIMRAFFWVVAEGQNVAQGIFSDVAAWLGNH